MHCCTNTNWDQSEESRIADKALDCAFKVHRTLGPGLLESVYHKVLLHELRRAGLAVESEVVIPVVYDGIAFEFGFRADIIVEKKVIIEIKSVETVLPVHKKQLLTYLKITGLKLGLLLNFNTALLKEGIVRLANGL
ncbi:MAG: GxxExxY protein [Spirochaetes bacterium]|nr:GxxExxY protein [Spirochaetota bacterium]